MAGVWGPCHPLRVSVIGLESCCDGALLVARCRVRAGHLGKVNNRLRPPLDFPHATFPGFSVNSALDFHFGRPPAATWLDFGIAPGPRLLISRCWSADSISGPDLTSCILRLRTATKVNKPATHQPNNRFRSCREQRHHSISPAKQKTNKPTQSHTPLTDSPARHTTLAFTQPTLHAPAPHPQCPTTKYKYRYKYNHNHRQCHHIITTSNPVRRRRPPRNRRAAARRRRTVATRPPPARARAASSRGP